MLILSEEFILKVIENAKQSGVSGCLELLRKHPKIKFATFQFIQSKPNRYYVPFVRTTYPSEWINYYLQHNFMESDPVIRHCVNVNDPFFWSQIKASRNEAIVMKQASDFGISQVGYSIPTYDLGPYRGHLSFNSSTNERIEWEQEITQYEPLWKKLALTIHQMARKTIDPQNEYIHSLSNREIECLILVADGKTYSEIAHILQISDHTVRGYIRSLRIKLNCTTLAQAVGRAKELKII